MSINRFWKRSGGSKSTTVVGLSEDKLLITKTLLINLIRGVDSKIEALKATTTADNTSSTEIQQLNAKIDEEIRKIQTQLASISANNGSSTESQQINAKIDEEIRKIQSQLALSSVSNTSSTEIQQLNERISGITPQIIALTRLVNEKNDQITTLRNSLNEIKEDVDEFKVTVEIDDVSRETRIIAVEDQMKDLFKSTPLELKENITGDLNIVSSNKIHYLMGYIVLSTDQTNPTICDLPDIDIFSPVAHIGVNKRNQLALPFSFDNNRNSITLQGKFKANDILYFNHLIRIDV